MYFPASNRSLTRALMAGALVFTGTAACSPDRSESGRDTNAAVMQDTMTPGTAQGWNTGDDTTTSVDTMTGAGTATGDTAPARLQSDAPRAATAAPAAEHQDHPVADTASAGYRAMEQDTAAPPVQSDSARVTEDTTEMSQIISDTAARISDTVSSEVAAADTAAAGYVAMARDTSAAADQIDTATAAVEDTAGAIQVQVDTMQRDTEVAMADSGEAIVAGVADTTGNDSTEVLATVDAADTADEVPVNPSAQETDVDDSERVAAARTDEVGAAAIAGTVTGADAVALMTRQGARCIVVDPEVNEEVRWHMSNTPATLNPCGLGSMNLSKVWTER